MGVYGRTSQSTRTLHPSLYPPALALSISVTHARTWHNIPKSPSQSYTHYFNLPEMSL